MWLSGILMYSQCTFIRNYMAWLFNWHHADSCIWSLQKIQSSIDLPFSVSVIIFASSFFFSFFFWNASSRTPAPSSDWVEMLSLCKQNKQDEIIFRCFALSGQPPLSRRTARRISLKQLIPDHVSSPFCLWVLCYDNPQCVTWYSWIHSGSNSHS